jgi:hypothetical protein
VIVPTSTHATPTAATFRLSPQQLRFFEVFGFLRLKGLFAAEAERIQRGFEEVFSGDLTWETHEELHFNDQRQIIVQVVSKSPDLSWLLTDGRVTGIVESLLGPGAEYAESDGNLFYCDTSWHSDMYSAPLDQYHLKLSFYLDPLTRDTGAIRMIPGTNWHETAYAERLRRDLASPGVIEGNFGVAPVDIPSWTLESTPGDVIIWNFRTIHASFGGEHRRRLFSMNYRQAGSADA